MIYRLQRKFIIISAVSVFAVIFIIQMLTMMLSIRALNRSLDTLTDIISSENGRFPDSFGNRPPNKKDPNMNNSFITPETKFSTRHFTVWLSEDGEAVRVNTEFIFSVDESLAKEYASRVMESEREKGWISGFRYRVIESKSGSAVIFVDGSVSRANLWHSMIILAMVLAASALVILLLIIILSKRAVRPVAESYEKQRQFITDANHELKTPLTLILTNLDIAESEIGENEWLEDIRYEADRMSDLVNKLVFLSRMEEEKNESESVFDLSATVSDTVSEFSGISNSGSINVISEISDNIMFKGDEFLIRRLVSVLMDNAVKYCDKGGRIKITLMEKRQIILTVENTYSEVCHTELERLFDRFYRADKSRSYNGSFGIGLSIAKSIVTKYKGEISAYKKDDETIGFRAVFRNI